MSKIIRRFSSGGIVYHEGKVLTIKSRSRNSIEFPKGTIEPNENKEDTCIREVFEETGYKTRIVEPLGDVTFDFDWSDGKHYRKTVYHYLLDLVDDSAPTPHREPDEDYDDLWFDLADVNDKLTYDDNKEVLRRAINTLNLEKL